MRLLSNLLFVSVLTLGPMPCTLAATKVTTIESSVIVEDVGSKSTERVITITGPDRMTYRLQASPTEVDRLASVVSSNPEARISFRGKVTDTNGDRVFKLNEWKEVERTTTTTTTDMLGNKTTETETERKTLR